MKYFVKATTWLRICVVVLSVIFAISITGCDEIGPIVVDATSPPPEWEEWYGGIDGKWYGDVDDWAVTKPIGDLLQPSVRLIYFLPSDREVRPERASALSQMITEVQEFYADEMERHGFGRKTFTLETDTGGIPIVHFVRGKFEEGYYERATGYRVWGECFGYINDFRHIYFIVIDNSYELLWKGRACGFGEVTFIPASGEVVYHFDSIAVRHRDETTGESALGGGHPHPCIRILFLKRWKPLSSTQNPNARTRTCFWVGA